MDTHIMLSSLASLIFVCMAAFVILPKLLLSKFCKMSKHIDFKNSSSKDGMDLKRVPYFPMEIMGKLVLSRECELVAVKLGNKVLLIALGQSCMSRSLSQKYISNCSNITVVDLNVFENIGVGQGEETCNDELTRSDI